MEILVKGPLSIKEMLKNLSIYKNGQSCEK